MKEKIMEYVETWENRCYFDGIPDMTPIEVEHLNNVPSYRKIALSILNNDQQLKRLGYTGKKSKYYDFYKRIELDKRQKVKQLKLEI